MFPATVLGVAFLCFGFMHIAVYSYVSAYPYVTGEVPSPERLRGVVAFMTTTLLRVVFFALAAAAGYLVVRHGFEARRIPTLGGAYLLGGTAGVLAAVVLHIGVAYLYPGLDYHEMLLFALLGAGAGAAGARLGRTPLAGAVALKKASQDLAGARTPSQVAAALGRHLDVPVAAVEVWKPSRSAQRGNLKEALAAGLEPWGEWTSGPTQAPGVGRLLTSPSLARLVDDGPTPIAVSSLPDAEAARWRQRGASELLCAPLYTPRDGVDRPLLVGLVTLSLGSGTAGRRARRLIASTAPEAAKNLDYMTLIAAQANQELRERLCRDIHDSVASCSAAVKTNLSALLSLEPFLNPAARACVERAHEAARQQHERSRELIAELAGTPEGVPLHKELAALVVDWERRSGISVSFAIPDGDAPLLGQAQNLSLIRAAREGLNNAEKHAALAPGGPPIRVSLLYGPASASLVVADAGRGFDARAAGQDEPEPGLRFGLVSLRRDLTVSGGDLILESAPGAGTRLCAVVPYETPAPPGPQTRQSEVQNP